MPQRQQNGWSEGAKIFERGGGRLPWVKLTTGLWTTRRRSFFPVTTCANKS
jgi:hypothetical protein